MCKKIFEKVQAKIYFMYFALFALIGGLAALPLKVFADDANPWGGGGKVNPDNLQKTISGDTTSTLKTVSVVVGTFLLLSGVTVLYKVLSRDADEKKEHGNSVLTLLIAGLCSIVGLILLGIAWKGLSAKV
jgi:Kef-type K+ transport system membrane component KefB